ncbi:RDD family protein [Bacteriovoracaceae bacterium]|nr:RDD family protein [Bacteriovoracaceae bacterium]
MIKRYVAPSVVKTSFISRLLAKSIDLFIILLLSLVMYPLGGLLGLLYLGYKDSLKNGQSVGKKLLGIRVTLLSSGEPCGYRQSLIRNLPFLIPVIFLMIPLWGWIFGIIMGVPVMTLEIFLLLRLNSGNRLGDVMGDTTVVSVQNDDLEN